MLLLCYTVRTSIEWRCFWCQHQDQPDYEEEPIDKRTHWSDLEEEEQEVEMDDDEMEDGTESMDSLSSNPTGIETPDGIELRKEQRKEPERPLYQALEEKSEHNTPGTVLGTTHTYVIKNGTQKKTGAKRVDVLRGQKTDQVEVSLQPEELEAMDNVLPANTRRKRGGEIAD